MAAKKKPTQPVPQGIASSNRVKPLNLAQRDRARREAAAERETGNHGPKGHG